MFKKIESGLKWGISGYLLFVVLGLISSYYSGSKILQDNLPLALRFAIYGGLGGFVFGFIEEEIEEDHAVHKGQQPVIRIKQHGGFWKAIEAVFSSLKFIVLIAIIILAVYAYIKYFRK